VPSARSRCAMCAADLQRGALRHEGPEEEHHAVQNGAMLVTCLLHTFKPLAAQILTAQHATASLLIKLKVHGSHRRTEFDRWAPMQFLRF
jgi:hypothetical protein